MSQPAPKPGRSVRHLRLPADAETLRTLRHDLRTPANSIIGYPELIAEECDPSAPLAFFEGVRQLGILGHRMLDLTNTVFGDAPCALRDLPADALAAECAAPADAALVLTRELTQQASGAPFAQARRDLERIAKATQRWRDQVAELLARHSEPAG